MNNNKRKKVQINTIGTSVLIEMALPRMSTVPGTTVLGCSGILAVSELRSAILADLDKLIPSLRPNQPEKAQISIEGDHGYRYLRIENSLTDEHGDEVKLTKGAHVDVTVAARPDVVK